VFQRHIHHSSDDWILSVRKRGQPTAQTTTGQDEQRAERHDQNRSDRTILFKAVQRRSHGWMPQDRQHLRHGPLLVVMFWDFWGHARKRSFDIN
jgi:hypothetical protein